MNNTEKKILNEIAGITDFPDGAYNIRVNGKSAGAQSTDKIKIDFKPDGKGIEVRVQPGTKNDRVHIPVVIDKDGHTEVVYNDFYIGEGADVTIVAGCGLHNCGTGLMQHDGVHTFYLEKGARVKYTEKHYGSGEGSGGRVLDPVTNAYLKEGSYFEMDTVQIEGVDSTKRITFAEIGEGAKLIIREKLMTHGAQKAVSEYDIRLNGKASATHIVSRSVAKGSSEQVFISKISGNNECSGHSECDAIIMDSAVVKAVPEITAANVDAALIHEAAIGKIAGEQIVKLTSLGLTEKDAEAEIIKGFLL